MRPEFFALMEKRFRQLETAPAVARTIGAMDSSIRLMTQRQYRSSNPAIAQVRAPLVAGLWLMAGLMAIILLWGTIAPIESSVVAKGSVVLEASKKTVQHLEGGIIKEIFVKEGDKVAAGQKLLSLQDTNLASSRDFLQDQLTTTQATETRLAAERDGLETVSFDPDLIAKSQANENVAKILATQQHLFDSEHSEQNAKLGVLNQRIAQSNEEIEGLKSRITGAAEQTDLLNQEIEMVKKLLKKGYATEPRLLALERNLSEVYSGKGEFEAQVAKVQQNITETQMAIIDAQKEFETKTLNDLHDAQTQSTELKNKLHAAEDVVGRTIITAPTEGIVTGLRYHTAGGVIEPGAPIMNIVPQDEPLVIEVHVRPTDISHLQTGLDARVMFMSYKARTTPKVPGKVTQISADSFTDEHNSAAPAYYVVRVEADKAFLKKMKKPVELYLGMPVDVLIRTGSRSFLSYLFKPITDSMHSAFREE